MHVMTIGYIPCAALSVELSWTLQGGGGGGARLCEFQWNVEWNAKVHMEVN